MNHELVDHEDIARRAHAYADAGADAVLIDGVRDLNLLRRLKSDLDVPLMFNQIAGGKSPHYTLTELQAAGVALVNYSTPCLFAAQEAIEKTMENLKKSDGKLRDSIGIQECNAILNANLRRRDED